MIVTPMEKRIIVADRDFLAPGELRATSLIETPYGFEPDDRLSRGSIKVAASSEAIAAAAEMEKVPGRSYFLVVALGDEEHWGVNNNGDSFPFNALMGLKPNLPVGVGDDIFDNYRRRIAKKWGYETFETGNTFQEHENSSPKLRIGGVHKAFWNKVMHRVELICWIEHELEDKRLQGLAQEILKAIDERGHYGISMACRVPFDRCSVCQNLAPTRRQYCSHLKNFRLLRGILPDGTSVSMINDFPVFFDNSFVRVPAAPEARTLFKVASDLKFAKHTKEAEITKEVEPLPDDIAEEVERDGDVVRALYHDEPRLPSVVMVRLRQFELPEVVMGLNKLGMALRPSEMMELLLGKDSHPEKMASLDRHALDVVVDPVVIDPKDSSYKAPDLEKVARVIDLVRPFMAARSYLEPYRSDRLLKIAMRQGTKIAAEDLSAPTEMDRVGLSVYEAAYASCEAVIKQANKTMWRWAAPGIAGLGLTMYEQDMAAKHVDPHTGDFAGAKNPIRDLAVYHPAVTTAGGAVMARKAMDFGKGLFGAIK